MNSEELLEQVNEKKRKSCEEVEINKENQKILPPLKKIKSTDKTDNESKENSVIQDANATNNDSNVSENHTDDDIQLKLESSEAESQEDTSQNESVVVSVHYTETDLVKDAENVSIDDVENQSQTSDQMENSVTPKPEPKRRGRKKKIANAEDSNTSASEKTPKKKGDESQPETESEEDDGIEIKNGDIKNVRTLRKFIKSQDNSANYVYMSNIPESCKTGPCILGIDEAGRGPVLGPMVYGMVFCPTTFENELNDIKCADSKTLSEKEREKLFDSLMSNADQIGWACEFLSPTVISNQMLGREKVSLNEIAANSTIALLKRIIDGGAKIKRVFVDTLGPPEKYEKRLTETFENKLEFLVRKKADSLFPIVSAASICAKVSRDQSIATWKFEPGLNLATQQLGSGYPNDPLTKKFLQSNMDPVFGYPGIVRFSWSTCENMLKESAVKVTWSDEETEGSKKKSGGAKAKKPVAKSSKITSFFVKKADDFERPNFYTINNLHIVEDL